MFISEVWTSEVDSLKNLYFRTTFSNNVIKLPICSLEAYCFILTNECQQAAPNVQMIPYYLTAVFVIVLLTNYLVNPFTATTL